MDIKDVFTTTLRDLISTGNNRTTVIVACCIVETLISDLIQQHTKHASKYRRLSLSAKLDILHELGIVSDFDYERISHLRKIRNDAAHNPIFEVDVSSIKDGWIKQSVYKHDRLNDFLINVACGFWNNHPEIRNPDVDWSVQNE